MGYYIKHDDTGSSEGSVSSNNTQNNSSTKQNTESAYKIARQKIDSRVQSHKEFKDYKKNKFSNDIKNVKNKYTSIDHSKSVRAANLIISGNYEGTKKAAEWIKDNILN